MSKPIGEPPTADELQATVEEYFQQYSYGPVSPTRVSANNLIFQSDTYPVQFELIIDDGMESIQYKVYEVPQDGDAKTFADNTKHFDIPFNPDMTWHRALSRLLMAISGSINGAINRGELEPRS
jgi:hypothetical protein